MELSEPQALEIFLGIHAAWNARNLERTLSFYTDDIVYWNNLGPQGGPVETRGKDKLRDYLLFWKDKKVVTIPGAFTFNDGVGRGHVSYRIEDGQTHVATYRQVFKYRGPAVCRLEDYVDSEPLKAFVTLIKRSSGI